MNSSQDVCIVETQNESYANICDNNIATEPEPDQKHQSIQLNFCV